MKESIGVELLRSNKVNSKEKTFEINDTKLKGFTLKIYPDTVSKKGEIIPGAKTYLVRYRLPDGKQSRIIIGRHTLYTPAQARDKAEKILRNIKDGINPKIEKQHPKVSHTFKSFLEDEYSPWAEAQRKDGKATVKRLKSRFSDFLDLPLTEITPLIVDKWRTGRLKASKRPATCNRDLTAIKAFLSKAVEWEHLEHHPLAKVKPLKVDSVAKVRFLSADEEKRLLKALDDREEVARAERATANLWRKERGYPLYTDLNSVTFADHLKPMVLVSLNTGIRWGELASLAWDSVDMKKSLITVIGDKAKSGKTRHVPLNSIALNALKDWKKQSGGEVVFPGRDGKKTLDNVNKSWKAVLGAAQIKNFRWHDMRHHFASWLVMAGVDLNTVRELLGHSDLKMTLRYAHLAPEHKAAAVGLLVKKK